MAHLLSTIPYEDRTPPPPELPKRQADEGYVRPARETQSYVPDYAAGLTE
jgi:hypothetical protein